MKTDLEGILLSAVTKNGLSGNKDYTKWAIEEDSSIMTKNKNTCKFNIFADGCPIFRTFIIGSIFAVFKSHHLKIRGLTYAGRGR